MPQTPPDLVSDGPAQPGYRAVSTLALDIGDVLLSMGVPATEVVSAAIDVIDGLASRKAYVDVLSNVLILTSAATPDAQPTTVMRSVAVRGLDYAVVQGVHELVDGIRAGRVGLDEANARLTALLARSPRYPAWHRTVSAGLVSASCPLLFGGNWLTVLATFVAGIVCDLVLRVCYRLRMPVVFVQAVSAGSVVVASALLAALVSLTPGWQVDGTMVVVSGIVMLVVGLMFVGSFQDAIDEYYLTAGARVFRVAMLTAGVVVGVLGGVVVARWLGVGLHVNPDPLPLGEPTLMTLGAAAIAGTYAWYCQARPTAILASALVGAGVWLVFWPLYLAGLGEIPASGVAAAVAGLLGALVARRWRIPGMAVTTAGIVTLVPGLRLMNGLLQIMAGAGWSGLPAGSMTLLGALGIAFAIAAGASFGTIVGRPIRQRLLLARNIARHRRQLRRPTREPGHASQVTPS